ncbi:MAG: 6-hydroxycyclohex-1-ene-1-carbonyl-CoA dehydrogenase [Tetrasphaera sp.]
MTSPSAPLERTEMDVVAPPAGHVVVEVAGCGICHTDLGYLFDGVRTNQALPLVLGHEISGRVVGTAADTADWQGRAVLVCAVIPCGRCETCARGRSTICPDQQMPGNDIDGGFATHVTVPTSGLCPIDEDRLAAVGLDLADIAVIADAFTTPYQAVVQAEVAVGDVAVVIGAGGVGSGCVQIAAAMGAAVVAIDVDDAKLAVVANHGAALTVNSREQDPRGLKRQIAAFAAERGLRSREWTIFECSGTAAGQSTAWGLLVHGATLAVVGFTMDKVEIRLSNLMALHARALGNWGCPPELYPAVVDLVLDGRVAISPFIERHSLEDINDVLTAVHERRITRRAIVVP